MRKLHGQQVDNMFLASTFTIYEAYSRGLELNQAKITKWTMYFLFIMNISSFFGLDKYFKVGGFDSS